MTMRRFKILYNTSDSNSFCHKSFIKFLSRYFDVVEFKDDINYNKQDTLLAVNVFKNGNPDASYWYRPYLEQGFKILVDGLWEQKGFHHENAHQLNIPHWTETEGDFFICHIKNWFWYLESMWYTDLGYQSYRPNKTYTKLALMPMRVDRWHRKETFARMSSMLDNMIWSYAQHGKYLPDDMPNSCIDFHRHYHPTWYDNTYFSLVTETEVNTPPDIFVTEKTFKPMAFYHPFMCVAQPGHLSYLKSQGFETFENMFDESYDNIFDLNNRIQHIVNQSKSFKQEPYSQLTWDKLAHNHDRFYNRQIVESCLVKELIEPILEYANS
jgi:hypothetical protein